MFRRLSAALVFALLAASPLLAQHPPLSLCLVQTKPDAATQYDPSAGSWAIELDKLLSAQKLRSGVPLRITVLAASVEKDVLPGSAACSVPTLFSCRTRAGFPPGGVRWTMTTKTASSSPCGTAPPGRSSPAAHRLSAQSAGRTACLPAWSQSRSPAPPSLNKS